MLQAPRNLAADGFESPSAKIVIDETGGGVKISLDFVQPSLLGPQLTNLPTPSLVVTDDWWLFNTSLAPLNCPRLPDCDVLFALAGTPEAVSALQAQYSGRALLRAVNRAGHIQLISPEGAQLVGKARRG